MVLEKRLCYLSLNTTSHKSTALWQASHLLIRYPLRSDIDHTLIKCILLVKDAGLTTGAIRSPRYTYTDRSSNVSRINVCHISSIHTLFIELIIWYIYFVIQNIDVNATFLNMDSYRRRIDWMVLQNVKPQVTCHNKCGKIKIQP
jgi:hypothetical protein